MHNTHSGPAPSSLTPQLVRAHLEFGAAGKVPPTLPSLPERLGYFRTNYPWFAEATRDIGVDQKMGDAMLARFIIGMMPAPVAMAFAEVLEPSQAIHAKRHVQEAAYDHEQRIEQLEARVASLEAERRLREDREGVAW